MALQQIMAALEPLGLAALAVCPTEPVDRLPMLSDGRLPASMVLVGNVGSSLWPVFEASEEYRDARPDPLDRWSRRVGDTLAERFGALAVYPFDGPPYWPFQTWVGRCGETSVSPLGLLIHPRFGLWQAYRFALVIDQPCEPANVHLNFESPCVGCSGRPCLDACPVSAFGHHGYKRDACVAHLHEVSAVCPGQGCLARLACPIGTRFTYTTAHQRFHMQAFMAARPAC